MKRNFKSASIEVVKVKKADIIATSTPGPQQCVAPASDCSGYTACIGDMGD